MAESAAVTAIESVNGHNSPRANRRAVALAVGRKLATTGGSDVHELSDLGRAYTEFAEGTSNVENVLDALRSGRTMGAGSAPDFPVRVRLDWRTMLLRLRRGLRPI